MYFAIVYLRNYVCIGRIKGGQGVRHPTKCATLVLADHIGNWKITSEVLSCNASKTFN